MSLPDVESAQYPTPDEVLSQMLSDVRWAYAQNGVTVNVSPGSELYERFKVIAARVSIAIANNELALADVSPLDSTGDKLEEYAGLWGVTKRPASSGLGMVVVTVLAPAAAVTIPDGFVCTSPSGIQYATVGAHTVATNETVSVQAVSAGAGTDATYGTVLTWDSAAIGYLGQTATVAVGGITGGAAADTEEKLRERFLERIRAPAVGGNAAHVSTLAENASAGVERCFVYPALRGPSSYDVSITAEGGTRAHSNSVVNLAANSILGDMPGSENLNATTVRPEYVDVVIDVTLPLPVSAGGAGGGWRDTLPWPSTAETVANTFAQITGVNTTTKTITVNSSAANIPVTGVRFGVWDPVAGEMLEFVAGTIGGPPGAYTIVLDNTSPSSMTGLVANVGMCCSAGCENLKEYADEFLAAVENLGPGQKTTDTARLPRSLRCPAVDEEWPTSLTALQTTSVINAHGELLDMTYKGRFATGTFTALTSPTVPTNLTDPPKILVLKNLSFRRQI